jgi:hypothetical protein
MTHHPEDDPPDEFPFDEEPSPSPTPAAPAQAPLSDHLKRAGGALHDAAKLAAAAAAAADFLEEQASHTRQAQPATQTSSSGSENLHKLGVVIDNWADLIEGRGDKAAEVALAVRRDLSNRGMPDVKISHVVGTVGAFSTRRNHTLMTTNPGVTTTIYIGPHGQDLYVAWRTYVRRVFNKTTLFVLLVLATLVALITGLPGSWGDSSGDNLLGPAGETLRLCCGIFVIALLFLVGVGAVIALGYAMYGEPFALLYVQPTIFDADDTIAMSMTAHLAIKKALEQVEIDSAVLRDKPAFASGRRGVKV